MKVFAYQSALCRLNNKLMVLKVVKQNGAQELFMNMYVVIVQQYNIDDHVHDLFCFENSLYCLLCYSTQDIVG